MAHAYKKTLLAQLGFADADKQNPKHDLAVEYLALPHNAKRLIASMHAELSWEKPMERLGTPEVAFGGTELNEQRRSSTILSKCYRPERERPLTKGEDRYKTTVGFLDLVLRFRVTTTVITTLLKTSWRDEQREEFPLVVNDDHVVAIEVKAGPVGTGDLLRQVKLYREYEEQLRNGRAPVSWMVAGCFKFTETQANALRQERIHVVSLGPLFDEWAERQRTDRTIATDIEEF